MNNGFWIQEKGKDAEKWGIDGPLPSAWPNDCHYFPKAFRDIDSRIGASGLRFVMTWDIERLPFTGNDVVVFLIGDERFQIPSYAGKVRAVFKNGGVRSEFPGNPFRLPLPLFFLETARMARNAALLLARRTRDGFPLLPKNVFPIPFGYWCPEDVRPETPMSARAHDVFFAGNVGKRGGSIRMPRTPKEYARTALLRIMGEIAAKVPEMRVYPPAEKIRQGLHLNLRDYADALSASKICLCPRGNIVETFRLSEAARAGCVLISEPLPELWYYDGCPAIQVSRWDGLPKLLGRLLSDPEGLSRLSVETRRWWETRMSEHALASFVVEKLR